MTTYLDKIHLNVLDCERNSLHYVVETCKGELLHKNVLSASQRMDRIIVNWYRIKNIKSNSRNIF